MALALFRIMIPVSIFIRLLEITEITPWFGQALAPFMKFTGLPGESGLVWATTLLTNMYGGMLVFYNMPAAQHYTVAQVTVLCCMMLVGHTFPIELQVARKAGIRIGVMFIIRFGFGLLTGILLNLIFETFGILQYHQDPTWKPSRASEPGWLPWLQTELKNYAMILLVIFALLLLMRVLKATGILRLISNGLKPLLGILGISKETIPITMIGLTMGILYGGALMIKEAKENNLPKLDVFYAMTMMGLCHSLIEDSLLMMSLGAHWSGVFLFRILFAILITWLIVQVTRRLPKGIAERWLLRG